MKKECKTCHYWHTTVKHEALAMCRRFPPQVASRSVSRQPSTLFTDTCGERKRRKA